MTRNKGWISSNRWNKNMSVTDNNVKKIWEVDKDTENFLIKIK